MVIETRGRAGLGGAGRGGAARGLGAGRGAAATGQGRGVAAAVATAQANQIPAAGQPAQLNEQQLAQVANMVNTTMGTVITNQIAPLIQNVVQAALAALPQAGNQQPPPPPPAQNPIDDLEALLVQAQIADAGHRHAIRASGIASVADLQLLRKYSDARTNFSKTLSRDHKVNLGLQQQNNLHAAGWWVHALTIRQQAIIPAAFDADALTQALAACSATKKPVEPTHMIYYDSKTNWFSFFEQFAQMLDGLSGQNDSTTLRYVVTPPRTAGTPPRRPFTEADYQLPTTGYAFDSDNARVAALWIQALSKNSSANLSVDAELTASDGRGAAHKLINELEGTSHVLIRIETAKNDLKKLLYTGQETKFPFADFINKSRLLYRILDENPAHKVHVEVQVKETYDRMKLREDDMKSARMNALRSHPKDLDKFAETFLNELAIIRPPSSTPNERRPGRGVSETEGKGKRRGRGKGGKGGKKSKKDKLHYDWSKFYPELEGREIKDVFNIPNYGTLSPEAKTWVRKYKENLAKQQVKTKGISLSEATVTPPLSEADALVAQINKLEQRLVEQLTPAKAKDDSNKGAKNGKAFGRNRDLTDE